MNSANGAVSIWYTKKGRNEKSGKGRKGY